MVGLAWKKIGLEYVGECAEIQYAKLLCTTYSKVAWMVAWKVVPLAGHIVGISSSMYSDSWWNSPRRMSWTMKEEIPN